MNALTRQKYSKKYFLKAHHWQFSVEVKKTKHAMCNGNDLLDQADGPTSAVPTGQD